MENLNNNVNNIMQNNVQYVQQDDVINVDLSNMTERRNFYYSLNARSIELMKTIKNKMENEGEWDSLIKQYSEKNTDYVMDMQERGENVDFRDSFIYGRQDEKFIKYVQNLRDVYKGCSSLNMRLVYCEDELNSNNMENVRNVFNKAFETYNKLKKYYNIAETIIVKNMKSLLRGNLKDEDILKFKEFNFVEFK